MNLSAFFDDVRHSLFNGKLTARQVSGMEFILEQWNETGFTNCQWLAYALATAFHETALTMQPIREIGGKAYFTRMYDIRGDRPNKARELGNLSPGDGVKYAGRGYVQLTGKTNYNRASQALGVDFVRQPDLVMDPANAAFIMFQGMKDGWFTGKGFDDYLGYGKSDYRNARRIINGTDKAAEIARYAEMFRAALREVDMDRGQPRSIPKPTTTETQTHWLARLLLALWKAFRS
jgi:predicted chitinase